MKRIAVCVLMVGLMLVSATEVAADPDLKVLQVQCPEGSVNQALTDRAKKLLIEISGTCHEDVQVTRDNVTLRGVGEDPTLVGVEERWGVVYIHDADRVSLESLTIQGGKGNGVMIASSGFVSLFDMTIQDNASDGIQIFRSTVSIEDAVVRRHGLAGIVVRWSDVAMWGVIDVSLSGTAGIRLERSSRLDGIARISSNENYIGFNSCCSNRASLWGLEASRNTFGVYLGYGSVLHLWDELKLVSNTAYGLYARMDSGVDTLGVDCRDNGGFGILLDESYVEFIDAVIQGNAGLDLMLRYGTRAHFTGDHDIGSIVCDETVLTSGNVSCPEPEAGMTKKLLMMPEMPSDFRNLTTAPADQRPSVSRR